MVEICPLRLEASLVAVDFVDSSPWSSWASDAQYASYCSWDRFLNSSAV
jgi:hypothetical protein